MSRAINPLVIETVKRAANCDDLDARRIIHAMRAAEAQVNAPVITELEGQLKWLQSLHAFHPNPTHLELNMAHVNVRLAIELLKG